MDKKTKKALEELQKAISGGEFDEFFKDEKRIIDYLDSKVKRMVNDLDITPELEQRVIKWFTKRRRVFYKNPNLWYGLLNVVIEEGILTIEGKFEEDDLFLVNSMLWRGYTFKQYWSKEETMIVVFKDNVELLRM